MFILGLLVLAAVGGVFMVIQYFRGGYHHKVKGCETFGQAVKRCITSPFYYHFGCSCPMCGKNYFSGKKARMCCPGPHNQFYGDIGKTMRYLHPNTTTGADRWNGIGYYGGYNKQDKKWL